MGSQRIEWRRRPSRRALSNLVWYGVVSAPVVACVWLLFGGEPGQTETGASNPLAALPIAATAVAAAVAGLVALPVFLPPTVAADHYALFVRVGPGRRLTLPWSALEEIRVVTTGHERFLLVRCVAGRPTAGDRPSWLDQAPLRGLWKRDTEGDWDAFDLAVPMEGFVGRAQAQVTALAAFAPDSVVFSGDAG